MACRHHRMCRRAAPPKAGRDGFRKPIGSCRNARRTSSVTHRRYRRPARPEIRPDLSPAPAASGTGKAALDVGQPYRIRPAIGADGDMMAAPVIGAIDQDAAQAHLAHLAERDFDRPAVGVRGRVAADRTGHAAIEARRRRESNYQSLGPQNARELLRVVGVEGPAAQYSASTSRVTCLNHTTPSTTSANTTANRIQPISRPRSWTQRPPRARQSICQHGAHTGEMRGGTFAG